MEAGGIYTTEYVEPDNKRRASNKKPFSWSSKKFGSKDSSMDSSLNEVAAPKSERRLSRKGSISAVVATIRMGENRRSMQSKPLEKKIPIDENVAKSEPDMLNASSPDGIQAKPSNGIFCGY